MTQRLRNHRFEMCPTELLAQVNGGFSAADMEPGAVKVMQRESAGNPHAIFGTKANGGGDLFGAFGLPSCARKALMPGHESSTDLGEQYAAATKYANARYGSWGNAWSATRNGMFASGCKGL